MRSSITRKNAKNGFIFYLFLVNRQVNVLIENILIVSKFEADDVIKIYEEDQDEEKEES